MAIDNDTTRRRYPSSNKAADIDVASGGAWNSPQRKYNKKKRRRSNDIDDDVPFIQIFAQVGIILLAFCAALWLAYRGFSHFRPPQETDATRSQFEYDDDDDTFNQEQETISPKEPKSIVEVLKGFLSRPEPETEIPEETYPPLPTFTLSKSSQWDAYALAEKQSGSADDEFWGASKELRKRFADTYGGENAARMLLDKGMTTFFFSKDGNVPKDIVHTACRFQKAQDEKRPLRLSFAGYSVTAGRGNLFHQSFPFQLQRILNKVARLAGVKEGLDVRNAAIGGAPSFPYAFCFENFLGPNPDVISWDFSMNEAGGVPEGLEAYLRHVIHTYSMKRGMAVPKIVVKDTHLAPLRREVLHEYTHWIPDSVVLHTDPAVKPFLERDEEYRPIGFQDWRKFGAPNGAPGQAAHHPALKEHELLGWILAMHFLTALEYKVMVGSDLQCPRISDAATPRLSHPVSDVITNNTDLRYDPILFGSPVSQDEWKINPIQCRTTFQPILNGDLSDVVVNGSIAEDLDIFLPKSQYYYNQGWVLDMSDGMKTVMRKLSTFENSLGYIDSKEAYYGVFESPHLNLLLPYSNSGSVGDGDRHQQSAIPRIGQDANQWFQSIVICQVNEQRDENECDFAQDVGVSIGGVNMTDISPHMIDMGGALYLGKKVCSHIPVPEGSTLTSHNVLARKKTGLEEKDGAALDEVGLLVQIFVTNPHIVHAKQACSISHVIWEEKTM